MYIYIYISIDEYINISTDQYPYPFWLKTFPSTAVVRMSRQAHHGVWLILVVHAAVPHRVVEARFLYICYFVFFRCCVFLLFVFFFLFFVLFVSFCLQGGGGRTPRLFIHVPALIPQTAARCASPVKQQ